MEVIYRESSRYDYDMFKVVSLRETKLQVLLST